MDNQMTESAEKLPVRLGTAPKRAKIWNEATPLKSFKLFRSGV
jgi:hypothetical protein